MTYFFLKFKVNCCIFPSTGLHLVYNGENEGQVVLLICETNMMYLNGHRTSSALHVYEKAKFV